LTAVILATGDVGAHRDDLSSIFRGCRDLLTSGDLTFGQLETVISARGGVVPNARLAMRSAPEMAKAAREAGFSIMSFAGNHCLDWGYEAFDDTLAHAREAGLSLCGAGNDLDEARRPLFADAGDVRVAIVAASSILPEGYAAAERKAGCAPLRAHTVYEQIEHDQPGTPARIRTYPNRADLAAMCDSIRTASAQADIVLVSLHWGIHMTEAVIADYQRIAARALIDAGAHAIIGHHPHILKGVEFYRGRPIFYSLGNFAIEQPHVWDPAILNTASFKHLVSLNPSWNLETSYMLPEKTRLTGVAKLICDAQGLLEVRFAPAYIADDSAPIMLAPDDERFERVRAYLEEISRTAGFETAFTADGDDLLLTAA
jgi:poly-gamma-glutamate synthesis protein (capsule biosynthesis protein)